MFQKRAGLELLRVKGVVVVSGGEEGEGDTQGHHKRRSSTWNDDKRKYIDAGHEIRFHAGVL